MKDISIDDYSYDLPANRIANFPLPQRDLSKLLVCKKAIFSEDVYRNLATYLPANSLIVFNNSRVISARLIFSKQGGGKIEIFCLQPVDDAGGMHLALMQKGQADWVCLVGGASKWKAGQVLEKGFESAGKPGILRALYKSKATEAFVIHFEWDNVDLNFAEVLELVGATPLPPYIKRAADITDKDRYQTIYADEAGSVAAPTAGLHFTPSIMEQLAAKNIDPVFVTLHVGAGTFRPVKSATMRDHEMHSEFIDIGLDSLIRITENAGSHITAVGTTSIRTLESLYWMGVKILKNVMVNEDYIAVEQWFAAENNECEVSASQALSALCNWMTGKKLSRLITKTQLLIAPGYKFRVADALITNFHQPKSTLLLLIAAMAGKEWRTIYDYALANEFRFLSYGDGCLIFRDQD